MIRRPRVSLIDAEPRVGTGRCGRKQSGLLGRDWAPSMLSMTRHGVRLVLDDDGFATTPWVYKPVAKDRWYKEGLL
jgi:hypothetical protein